MNRAFLGLCSPVSLAAMTRAGLSRLELTVNELRPLLLHSSTERNYWQVVELAYPITVVDPTGFESQQNVSVSRSRLIGVNRKLLSGHGCCALLSVYGSLWRKVREFWGSG